MGALVASPTSSLRWIWLAPLVTGAVCWWAGRDAFRRAGAEQDDLDRRELLEHLAMGFLGAGVLDVAVAGLFGIAAAVTSQSPF